MQKFQVFPSIQEEVVAQCCSKSNFILEGILIEFIGANDDFMGELFF